MLYALGYVTVHREIMILLRPQVWERNLSFRPKGADLAQKE